jgi:pimeloyl-ACP methyl ester carboxylesterase
MALAEIDGVKIAYRRSGKGTPLLLLHGITTYSFLWKDMIPGLAERYDVIAPDLLNCGASDKTRERDSSPKAQSRLMTGLLDHLGVGSAHLAAHDVGGAVAQIAAAEHPNRFLSLTLLNTVGYDYWPVQPIITMRVPILRLIALAAFDLGVFRALVRRGFYHRDKVDDALMELFQRPLGDREGKDGFLAFAGALDNSQLMAIADDLPKLPMPVMIVRGDADIYLKPVISVRLHQAIPASRLERIPTAGHFSPLDEPDLHVELIKDFLSSSG